MFNEIITNNCTKGLIEWRDDEKSEKQFVYTLRRAEWLQSQFSKESTEVSEKLQKEKQKENPESIARSKIWLSMSSFYAIGKQIIKQPFSWLLINSVGSCSVAQATFPAVIYFAEL